MNSNGLKLIASLWAISSMISNAAADSPEVIYAPPAKWVLPTPEGSPANVQDGTMIKMIYSDNQVKVGDGGDQVYTAYRIKILRPEALQAGNINVTWKPTTGSVTVHSVTLFRDGIAKDVLEKTKFKVVQQEQSLEQSILLGNATAILQIPGIAVDDEIEFKATVKNVDPTIGDRPFGFGLLPTRDLTGTHRIRVVWNKGLELKWQVSSDLNRPELVESGKIREFSLQSENPKTAIIPDGAPGRFKLRRLIEYTAFNSWGEISSRFWKLFEAASQLENDSPLKVQATKIASENADQLSQANAALQLVQRKVRYVYAGLGGGNYSPASAEETWERRFGDCKGKTTLLMALLKELGIEAEAVLVNLQGSDGVDERLPIPSIFNHVLVKAKIGGTEYWLDGTGLNDPLLEYQPKPNFGWSLPLRSRAGELTRVDRSPYEYPQLVDVIDLDASEGVDAPVQYKTQQVMRGQKANEMRNQLVSMSKEDADRALKGYWTNQFKDVEPENVEWTFDKKHAALLLKMQGSGTLDWGGSEYRGYRWYLYGAGFSPPSQLKRPKEQDQSAPWLTTFPRYKCWVTSIRLPEGGKDQSWDFVSAPIDRRLGGVHYWRRAGMQGNIVQTVMSSRTITPEIDAEQAAEIKTELSNFNNSKSYVYQTNTTPNNDSDEKHPLLSVNDIDWINDSSHCNNSNWQSD